MAVEQKRGCGYRKIGGIYLVVDGPGQPCGKFPIPLNDCTTCGHSPANGVAGPAIQRIKNLEVAARAGDCLLRSTDACNSCPFSTMALGRLVQEQPWAALMYVGQGFYTPKSFIIEAEEMGVSKRVSSVPKWFEVGKTWVYLAHIDAVSKPCDCAEKTEDKTIDPKCERCEGTGGYFEHGIFYAFRPSRVEVIIPNTMIAEDRTALIEKGYTLVEVPWDDPDHQPGAKAKEEPAAALA